MALETCITYFVYKSEVQRCRTQKYYANYGVHPTLNIVVGVKQTSVEVYQLKVP